MAYYSDGLIEEVISQNDIIDVISEYVTLKKSGRNFMGLCPFHREKTPSFCVSMDKQIFKCFGCSEGGNVISFIMKLENLDFWDSVEFLAERAHIDLSKYEINEYHKKDRDQEFIDKKDIRFKINREAAIYYHENLISLLKEKENLVKSYIIKRKLDIKTINKFGIGYANGKVQLYKYLLEKGFSDEDILSSDILVKNNNGKIYDRFFGRLIFPIFDIRDRVIAFGGRVLDKSLPKYVNSSENEIYSKGKNLYGLNIAKKQKLEYIIIVEGYMDVIALQKNGIYSAVASLGTALTENQARLIKKYTDTVIIGYDQDSAGQDATMRGLDILHSKGLKVKVLKLDKKDVKDPDEYINKYGVERYNNCIKSSISLVDFKISKIENQLDLDDMDSKVKFLTYVSTILANIENDIERQLYVDKISSKYNIGSGPILNEVEKRLKRVEQKEINIDMQSLNRKMQLVTNMKKRQEQYIIALLLCRDTKIQEKILKEISVDDIENSEVKKVYEFLIKLMNKFDINKIDILSKIKDESIMKEITDIMYIDVNVIDKNKLLNDVLNSKFKERLYIRRDEIINRMSENITNDEQEILQLELNQIILEISKFKKGER